MKTRNFTFTIEMEIPDHERSSDLCDEFLLSMITLHPMVGSRRFDGVRIKIKDIKNAEGKSIGGYPSETDISEYTFKDPNGYDFWMVKK